MLKEEISNDNREREVDKELLKESGFFTLFLFSQTLADVPVGDIVFNKMRSNDERNRNKRRFNLGGNKGASRTMDDGQHI